MHTAVIGAGLAGLTCAQRLQAQGHLVTVFEKSRGPSGRISTRRMNPGGMDHGAQYFTARSAPFIEQTQAWLAQGLIAVWDGRFVAIDAAAGTMQPTRGSVTRYVGVPAMNAIGHALAEGLDVLTEMRIEYALPSAAGWLLYAQGRDEPFGPFENLVLAVPAEQSVQFMQATSAQYALTQTPQNEITKPLFNEPFEQKILQEALKISTSPCWCVMLRFENQAAQALHALSLDGAFIENSPLSWISRNSSKPQRGVQSLHTQDWVLHATTDWSQVHLNDAPEQITEQLLAALNQALRCDAQTAVALNLRDATFSAAHRWLYSIAARPLEIGCLWDAGARFGVCGDWCSGSRVEGAYGSGVAMAQAVDPQA